jgi:hypothetical protein
MDRLIYKPTIWPVWNRGVITVGVVGKNDDIWQTFDDTREKTSGSNFGLCIF